MQRLSWWTKQEIQQNVEWVSLLGNRLALRALQELPFFIINGSLKGFFFFLCKEYSKNTFLSYGEAGRFVDV